MTKRMLVDATHPEETRVALVNGTWLDDFDFERASKKQLKGNIYLAKVIRIEPSLQAAFVEYGGNRHGFLPFSEIHPDYYRIPMADRPHDMPGEGTPPEEIDAGEEPAPTASEIAESTEVDIDADADSPYSGDEAHGDDPHPIDAPHDHDHHDHDHHDHAHAPLTEDAGLAPPAYSETAPAAPLPEFAAGADADLGLITDFGNAAVGDATLPAVTPIETVGGEVAEAAIVEERYRRPPPRHRYKIQEVVKRRQVMLIQVVKEERGNKGAALTTFLSLAGRYCVLMPNTEHGGGVSRKITSHQDRRRMKEILDQLEIPEGMAVILRTAGMEQAPAEIQRDMEYLLRTWNNIREQTLQSSAPALIYEEANLIKRSMRDLLTADVEEVLVAGKEGHQLAQDFMHTIMPDQANKVKLYEETVPLFFRYRVETQIDNLYGPTVQLRSGGYIVINPTEALVSIDVNSGRATRERHIEGTALKTNLEAAEEIARQLRLRDLAGLIVIDFIDMEDGRNNAAVERRMKESMRNDRARLQIGRISPFGLMELSRQRLRPSLMEINFEKCEHCGGVGLVRSIDSAALSILRMIEEEGIKQGAVELVLHVPTKIALYILNQKRPALAEIERRYGLQVLLHSDDELVPPDYRLERVRGGGERPAVNVEQMMEPATEFPPPVAENAGSGSGEGQSEEGQGRHQGGGRRRGRFGFGRGRNRGDRNDRADRGERGQQNYQQQNHPPHDAVPEGESESIGNVAEALPSEDNDNMGNVEAGGYEAPDAQPNQPRDPNDPRRGRRRGRRGGRGRRSGQGGAPGAPREGGGEFRQRGNYEQRPRSNNNWNRPYDGGANVNESAAIPASIHDLDTTPREPSAAPAYTPPPAPVHRAVESEKPVQAAPQPRQAISSAPYEIVDQPTDKPKGGWWKKLTGQ